MQNINRIYANVQSRRLGNVNTSVDVLTHNLLNTSTEELM